MTPIAYCVNENFMMNNNNVPQAPAQLSGTESENGKAADQLSNDNGGNNRQFGVMNLWSIRRNARAFRIHDRMPRL